MLAWTLVLGRGLGRGRRIGRAGWSLRAAIRAATAHAATAPLPASAAHSKQAIPRLISALLLLAAGHQLLLLLGRDQAAKFLMRLPMNFFNLLVLLLWRE